MLQEDKLPKILQIKNLFTELWKELDQYRTDDEVMNKIRKIVGKIEYLNFN